MKKAQVKSAPSDRHFDFLRRQTACQLLDEVCLAVLAKYHAIQHQRAAEVGLLADVATVRQSEHVPLDLGVARR